MLRLHGGSDSGDSRIAAVGEQATDSLNVAAHERLFERFYDGRQRGRTCKVAKLARFGAPAVQVRDTLVKRALRTARV